MTHPLLVIVPDRINDILKKGEYQPLYYNPGEVFDEVHLLLINDDRPDIEALRHTVGKAKLVLHNHPDDLNLPYMHHPLLTPLRLRTWARGGVDIARRIAPALIRCHGADWNAYLASRIKAELGTPYIVSLHINYDENPPRRYRQPEGLGQMKHNRFYDFIEKQGLRNADLVAPVYKPILPYLDRLNVKRVDVCYNVLDGGNLRRKTSYDLSDPPRLIYVGRLFDEKSPTAILRALVDLPGVQFLIVGDGPIRLDLEALARDLGLADRVMFRPAIRNDELCALLPDYDLFVIHSDYFEISKSVLEALLTGLPVIMNRRPGPQAPELETGVVHFVDNTPQAYRAAIEFYLTDHGARAALGRRAYEEAQRLYAPAAAEAKIAGHYRRLMRRTIKRAHA